MKGFKWDYHLTQKEQEYVDRGTPGSQARIQIACRADIEFRKKTYRAGAVALTEHFLLFFKKGMFGKKLKLGAMVHLLSIVMAQTKSETELDIQTHKEQIKIKTPVAVRLARYLMKSYGLSVWNLPEKQKVAFRSYDNSTSAKFNLVISPSQAYQFAFNARSSLVGTPYIHEITEFYHSLVLSQNPTFELNHLPLCTVSDRFREAADAQAVIGALKGDKLIYAVNAFDIDMPGAVLGLADILSTNQDLKIVRLKNCGAVEGPSECAVAIEQNHHLSVEFLDLSENPFKNIFPLIQELCAAKRPIWYLNLNHTNMTQKDISVLLKAIVKEKKFPDLKYLHLLGAPLTPQAVGLLCEWVSQEDCEVVSLEVEGEVLNLIRKLASQRKLTRLAVRTEKITTDFSSALSELFTKIPTMAYLDISHCEISDRDLIALIQKINEAESATDVTLKLDGITISERVADELAKANPAKYGCLSFTGSEMPGKAFHKVCEFLETCEDVREVSFNGKTIDAKALARIPVRSLTITGSHHVVDLLNQLKGNDSVQSLRLEECELGDEGYQALADFIKAKDGLQEIWADNGGANVLDPILACMAAVTESSAIHSAMIGVNDMIDIVLADKKKGHQLLTRFKEKEKEMKKKTYDNALGMGLKTSLMLLMLPELDQLLGDTIAYMNQNLANVDVQIHSAICKILDLPLPFQGSDQRYSPNGEDAGVLKTIVKEDVDDSLSNYKTLTLNSLVIKDHTRVRSGSVTIDSPVPVRHAGDVHERARNDDVEFGSDDEQ